MLSPGRTPSTPAVCRVGWFLQGAQREDKAARPAVQYPGEVGLCLVASTATRGGWVTQLASVPRTVGTGSRVPPGAGSGGCVRSSKTAPRGLSGTEAIGGFLSQTNMDRDFPVADPSGRHPL